MRTLKSVKNFRSDEFQAVLYMVLFILLIICPLLYHYLYRDLFGEGRRRFVFESVIGTFLPQTCKMTPQ